MAVARSAASKLDWANLTTTLSLKGTTAASLAAFKKRNDDARRRLAALKSQPSSVDLAHYRNVLNNTAVVDEIESFTKSWKPVSYDIGRQVKAIEAFEAQAMKSAEETKEVADKELGSLEKTLANIIGCRPWEELDVDDICAAAPEIDRRTELLVENGRWNVPGYKEKFGDYSII